MSIGKPTPIRINPSELILTSKLQGKAESNCPQCQTRVAMVTPEPASVLTGIPSQAIYRWIEDNQVHSQESAEGRLRICLNSLHQTYEDSLRKTKEAPAFVRPFLPSGEGKE
jgi:hypothetical protein